jgi:hypothetical protein
VLPALLLKHLVALPAACPPPSAQTVAHLIRKAGFEGSALLVRASLKVTRYQSTAYSLTHEEYLDSISTSSAAAAGRAAAKEGSGRRLPLPKQQPLVTVSASGQ